MLGLLADAPALPLDEAGKYVAGAYVVFLVLIVVYVAIMAAKLQRIERELRELASFAEQGNSHPPAGASDEVAEQADQGFLDGGAPGEGPADRAKSPHPQGVPDV